MTPAICAASFHSSCVLCSVVPINEKPVEMGVFWDPEPDEYRWMDALQVSQYEAANVAGSGGFST